MKVDHRPAAQPAARTARTSSSAAEHPTEAASKAPESPATTSTAKPSTPADRAAQLAASRHEEAALFSNRVISAPATRKSESSSKPASSSGNQLPLRDQARTIAASLSQAQTTLAALQASPTQSPAQLSAEKALRGQIASSQEKLGELSATSANGTAEKLKSLTSDKAAFNSKIAAEKKKDPSERKALDKKQAEGNATFEKEIVGAKLDRQRTVDVLGAAQKGQVLYIRDPQTVIQQVGSKLGSSIAGVQSKVAGEKASEKEFNSYAAQQEKAHPTEKAFWSSLQKKDDATYASTVKQLDTSLTSDRSQLGALRSDSKTDTSTREQAVTAQKQAFDSMISRMEQESPSQKSALETLRAKGDAHYAALLQNLSTESSTTLQGLSADAHQPTDSSVRATAAAQVAG